MTSHLLQLCNTISQHIVKHMQLNICYSYTIFCTYFRNKYYIYNLLYLNRNISIFYQCKIVLFT